MDRQGRQLIASGTNSMTHELIKFRSTRVTWKSKAPELFVLNNRLRVKGVKLYFEGSGGNLHF